MSTSNLSTILPFNVCLPAVPSMEASTGGKRSGSHSSSVRTKRVRTMAVPLYRADSEDLCVPVYSSSRR